MVFSIETNLRLLILCVVLFIINGLFALWFWIAQIISIFKPEWSYNYWGIRLFVTFIIGCILAFAISYLLTVSFVTAANEIVKTIPKTETNNNTQVTNAISVTVPASAPVTKLTASVL